MNILNERDKLLELKDKFKIFIKTDIADKLIKEESKDINIDLKLSYHYIDSVVKSIEEIDIALYQTDLLLNNFK
jgi:hypothetical protein